MNRGKYWLPVLLCFCLVGCIPVAFMTGAAAGIVSYQYYAGALTVIYKAPYMETWDATVRALETRNVAVTKKEHDLTKGHIEGKRGDRKDVLITVKYKSQEETEVVIRVGLLGDESASDAIHQEIKKQLFGE